MSGTEAVFLSPIVAPQFILRDTRKIFAEEILCGICIAEDDVEPIARVLTWMTRNNLGYVAKHRRDLDHSGKTLLRHGIGMPIYFGAAIAHW